LGISTPFLTLCLSACFPSWCQRGAKAEVRDSSLGMRKAEAKGQHEGIMGLSS
jgi:hypothetical protein